MISIKNTKGPISVTNVDRVMILVLLRLDLHFRHGLSEYLLRLYCYRGDNISTLKIIKEYNTVKIVGKIFILCILPDDAFYLYQASLK